MNTRRLRRAGVARREAKAAYERAHRRALDVLVDELAQDADADLKAAAKLAGVSRATAYNELRRRAAVVEGHDALDANGSTPVAAPFDTDRVA